jgi:hypothetical protein
VGYCDCSRTDGCSDGVCRPTGSTIGNIVGRLDGFLFDGCLEGSFDAVGLLVGVMGARIG